MAAAMTRAMPRRCWERVSVMWGSSRTGGVASAEQLADKVHWIVRDGVAPPGDVLIGARQNQFVVAGRLRWGNIDDVERDAAAAHRISQWLNRNIGIVAHQRVARPQRIVDRP